MMMPSRKSQHFTVFFFSFFFNFFQFFFLAFLEETKVQLNAKMSAIPDLELKERASLQAKAGILTTNYNDARVKLRNEISAMEEERDNIIADKRSKMAKAQTLWDDLKSACVANKDPTPDELNQIGAQQGAIYTFFHRSKCCF
jgi:hypothetical protein